MPSGITYREYWDLSVVPTFEGLSERTVYDYGRIWRIELEPLIGYRRVRDTTWRTVQNALNQITAPSVQHHAYRTWKKICNLAVRDGLLSANPIDRNIRLKAEKKRDKALMDRGELARLFDGAAGCKHIVIAAMEIGGGLRHEEACAVTRGDVEIDGDFAIVSVSKALTCAGGKVIRKDTKTAFSRRVVALGEPFRSIIAGNLAALPADVAGQSSPVTISRNWMKYCTRNGLPYIPFGQMRTQFSVMHQQAGSIDSLVSLAMGHSDGTTRGRNYTVNTLPAMKLLAANLTEWLMDDASMQRLLHDLNDNRR